MRNNKQYGLEASPLYRMRNRRKLAQLLGLSTDYFKKQHDYQYRTFPMTKKSGGERYVSDPEPSLKRMQKRLCNLLSRISTPDWVKSGKKHSSYINNADFHRNSHYVRTMDIASFYDSVQRKYVYDLFRNRFKMEGDIAAIITHMVLDSDGKLPTGSPTSQAVAYWSYKAMFDEIHDIAERYGCEFTLYVDDMTFSAQHPISDKMRYEVACLLKAWGLKAKARKDHYYRNGDVKYITGICIKDGKMLVPNRNRKRILDQYRKCGNEPSDDNFRKLQGMLNSARQIEAGLFSSIRLC